MSEEKIPIPPIEDTPIVSDLAKEEENAIIKERIRSIRRRSLVKDVSMYAKLTVASLLAFGLVASVLVYFLHHLTPLQWLDDTQIALVQPEHELIDVSAHALLAPVMINTVVAPL